MAQKSTQRGPKNGQKRVKWTVFFIGDDEPNPNTLFAARNTPMASVFGPLAQRNCHKRGWWGGLGGGDVVMQGLHDSMQNLVYTYNIQKSSCRPLVSAKS